MSGNRPWRASEDGAVRLAYAQATTCVDLRQAIATVAAQIGRSPLATRQRAKRLGITDQRRPKRWTAGRHAILKAVHDAYGIVGDAEVFLSRRTELAQRWSTTVPALRLMANRRRLTVPRIC